MVSLETIHLMSACATTPTRRPPSRTRARCFAFPSRRGTRSATESSGAAPKPKKKRTFKEEREYVELPSRIAALEQEQKHLQAAIHDPDFYKKPQNEIHAALERVTQIDEELLAAMERWDLLDSIGT